MSERARVILVVVGLALAVAVVAGVAWVQRSQDAKVTTDYCRAQGGRDC